MVSVSPMKPHPEIIVRDISFGIADAPLKHWYAGDPYKTAFCDALSICLPAGERFFIKAVKNFQHLAADQILKDDIKDFSRQEAYHTREHEGYNEGLRKLGYDVDAMEALVKKDLSTKRFSIKSLATTCAIEHITASFSQCILKHPRIFDGAEPKYRNLWFWHAAEELEHKGVAIDLFNIATKDMPSYQRYLLRTIAFTVVTWKINRLITINAFSMMQQDGVVKTKGFTFWTTAVYKLFFSPGLYGRSLGYFLGYYLPGFHPWKHESRELIEKWKTQLSLGQD